MCGASVNNPFATLVLSTGEDSIPYEGDAIVLYRRGSALCHHVSVYAYSDYTKSQNFTENVFLCEVLR